jgi:hypothetical protein
MSSILQMMFMVSSVSILQAIAKVSLSLVYLFGFTVYYTVDKNTILKISKKIEHSAMRSEKNDPAGFFFGRIYCGYITETTPEGVQTLYCVCSSNKFNQFTNNDSSIQTYEKFIKLYTRTGSNYYCLRYKSNNFNCSRLVPRNRQETILEDVVSYYKTNNRCVLMLTGEPGTGKSFIGILIAKALDGSLCKTYRPSEPGDSLRNLYDTVNPTEASPLVVVIDEFDLIIDTIHKTEVECHETIPIEIRNKMSWNTLLDDVNLNIYPFMIVVLTSNLDKASIISKYEQSYIRPGRVDLYHSL